MSKPRPYNIRDPQDLKRWFREMKGYLLINGSDGNFLHQGTDRPGRRYAWEAFLELETWLGEDIEIPREIEDKLRAIIKKHTLPPALPEGGTDVMR